VTDSQADPYSEERVARLLEQGSFEETLHALEAIVERLERGRISIDEAVNWYELGLALSRRCTKLLEQAELRISSLEEAFGSIIDDNTPGDPYES
jgi:exodeoxyribonuclease VII small subunit